MTAKLAFMKKPKEKKTVKRRKHIKATSITLEDAEGRPRIMMNAAGKDGAVFIVMNGQDGQQIAIQSDPDGMIGIHLHGRQQTGFVNISVTKDGAAVISLFDQNGKYGAVLAEEPKTSTHRLMLFQNGRHFWNTPSGKLPPPKV